MKIFPLAVILLLSGCGAAAFSQAASGSVFQSWNELQIAVPLVRGEDAKGKTFNKITANFSGILRLGRRPVDDVDDRVSVMLDFRLNPHVSVLTGILYRKDELVMGSPHTEIRFDTGVLLTANWHRFTFKERNLYEHRFRHGRADTDLYRQRIQISHPVSVDKKVLFSPFISEEGYF